MDDNAFYEHCAMRLDIRAYGAACNAAALYKRDHKDDKATYGALIAAAHALRPTWMKGMR